jgi:GNAT superfamily N-acetyltransferase
MTRDDYRITTRDAAKFSDDEISMETSIWNLVESELWPEDPVTPIEDAIAEARALPARLRRTAFRSWADDGTLAGSVQINIDPEREDNPDVISCSILVHPDHRRRGVATGLLRHVIDHAMAQGRSRLILKTFSRIPAGDSFASAIGATAKASSHTNHLPTYEVDRSMMEQWVRQGQTTAGAYELLAWDGRVPDEQLEAFVELVLVMNDAPRDELAVNDFTLTPTEWREGEERAAAVGQERWFLVARHRSDGHLVGLHDLAWVPAYPEAMFVGSTVVREEHRGHRLGKWLKATMMLRVLDEKPDVKDIRTDNADSNDAMMSINLEMGYCPLFGTTTWEVSAANAAEWVQTKTAPGRG